VTQPKPAAATAILLMILAGCASVAEEDQGESASSAEREETAPANVAEESADLTDAEGGVIGTATFIDTDGGTQVRVEVSGLPPGFHGMHLHEIGVCEPASPDPANPSRTGDFLSAGPHLGSADSSHGRHLGDLPPLLVNEQGLGSTTPLVGVAEVEDLLEGDGTSLVIHEAPDNLAHIPPRYAAGGPDQETLAGGDSGARIACGAIGD
jgi:Cu-Zn family superoxide dismutase